MLDLTPFTQLIQQFGPWGWIIAAVVLYLNYSRTKTAADPNPPALPILFPNLPSSPRATAPPATDADKLVSLASQIVTAIEAKHAEHASEAGKLKAALPVIPSAK